MAREQAYGSVASNKISKILKKTLVYLFLTIMAVIVFVPFFIMVLTSFKTADQTEALSFIWFLKPNQLQWNNYKEAYERIHFFRAVGNTVLVAMISTVGTILTTVLSAFAFARLNFKGKEILFSLLLTTMMIPGEMFVITNFQTVSQLGWLSGKYGEVLLSLTIPFMTSIFYIYYLRQNFKTIPNELYYAAKVDGTTDFGYLLRVMIPIAAPTIISITILNAMGSWNAYIWPSLVTTNEEYRLVTNALRDASFTVGSENRPHYPQQMAASVLVTLPLLVIFFLLKKQIMRGVSRSGIKG